MSCWSPAVLSLVVRSYIMTTMDMSMRIQRIISSDLFQEVLTCPTLWRLGEGRDRD